MNKCLGCEVNSGGGNIGAQWRLWREGCLAGGDLLDGFHITQQGCSYGPFFPQGFALQQKASKSKQKHKTYMFLILFLRCTHHTLQALRELKGHSFSFQYKYYVNNSCDKCSENQIETRKCIEVVQSFTQTAVVLPHEGFVQKDAHE